MGRVFDGGEGDETGSGSKDGAAYSFAGDSTELGEFEDTEKVVDGDEHGEVEAIADDCGGCVLGD